MPEFAAGLAHVQPVFGVTHNPYRHGLSAGGSSGGAAAALAAGFVPLAEGSDMGGSLRNPAAFCNVVGLRPTPGRVPTWPAAMGWSQLSVQGPMGRTVADVALQLSVIAGPDPRVPISLADDPAWFAAPLPESLDGLRVAWAPDLGGRVTVDPAITAVLAASVGVFEGLGASVEEACPDLSGADEVFGTLRAWLFDATVRRPRAASTRTRSRSRSAGTPRWGRSSPAPTWPAPRSLHTKLYERMVAFFERYDVLLAPTTQVLPFPVELEYPTEIAGVHQDNYLEWMRSCTLISATGCPALSVPGGFTPDGLPVGLQIIGRPRADRRVLEVGHAFEQATRFGERRPASLTAFYGSLATRARDRETTEIGDLGHQQADRRPGARDRASRSRRRSATRGRGGAGGGRRRRCAGRAACGRRPAARPARAGPPRRCRRAGRPRAPACCPSPSTHAATSFSGASVSAVRRLSTSSVSDACSMARSSRSEARAIDGQRRSRGRAMHQLAQRHQPEPLGQALHDLAGEGDGCAGPLG